MLYLPVLNVDVVVLAVFPPASAVTVTLVPDGYPAVGVKTTVWPCRDQDPAMAGVSDGIGALAGSGSLYVTVTPVAPFAAVAPPCGLIEISRSATGLVAACLAASAARVAWLPLPPPDDVTATMPAVAPPTAITAPDTQAAVFRDMLRTVFPPILRA